MNGISVVICCYNSSTRLKPTLEHLATQSLSQDIPWEIILVDNNSTDNTGEYAQMIWQTFDTLTPFQVITEKQAGLTFARKKGIQTAKYNFVLFCDDDNWLNSDYLKTAMEILQKNHNIGVLGGLAEAVSDIDLPNWFKENQAFYAVGEQLSKNRLFQQIVFVHGAGMVINKTFYLNCIKSGFEPLLTGRLKQKLSSGEDTEICFAMNLAGYQTFYTPDLHLKHFMTPERLTLDYFLKLRKGTILSSIVIAAYRDLLLNHNKRGIYFLFRVFGKFILKTPVFIYDFIRGNKLKMNNYYYYYYNLRYFYLYSNAWKKIKKWTEKIKSI